MMGCIAMKRFAALLLVVIVTCVISAHGLSFRLLSSEFVYSPSSDVKDNVVANGGAKHCVLVGLDERTTYGRVRFTYNSNVTSVSLRSSLVVTVHEPDGSYPNLASLSSAQTISQLQLFLALDLDKSLRASQEATRKLRNAGEAVNEAEARGQTVTATAVTVQLGSRKKVIEGNYGVCFSLDRRRQGVGKDKSAPTKLVEQVDIGVEDVIMSTEGSAENALKRVRFGREKQAQKLDVTDADIEAMVSRMDLVSGTEIMQRMDELKVTLSKIEAANSNSESLISRHLRMRKTNESTFTRVWVCTLFVMVVLVTSVWCTFYYTKALIKKKKLI